MKKNNWYVITGGPCSGKTTLLNELKKKGYKIYYEAARIFIDQEMKKRKTLKEIRKDELKFQKKVLNLKIQIEKKLPKNEILFLERGIPDSITYYQMCGVSNDDELNKAVKNSHYHKVFLLELLEFKKDYARTEIWATAKKIEKLLIQIYTNMDVTLIKVPFLPVEDRVKFILDNL